MPLHILPDSSNPNLIFVALKSKGLAILKEQPRSSVHQVASLSKADLGNLDATTIAQKDNLLYVALGDFFNSRGSKVGLAVVNIEDPENPFVVHLFQSKEKLKGSCCLHIEGNHLYLGAMSSGILIFRLKTPENPVLISRFQPDPDFPKKNPGIFAKPNIRDIQVFKDRMYLAYDAGGFRVIDISDREHPVEIGKYINQKLRGRPQAYNGIALDFPYAYVSIDYAGVEVLNIEDSNNIKQLAWWNPWSAGSSTKANNWFNSAGHTNQIILDKRKNRLLVSAGASKLILLNVENPDKPSILNRLPKCSDKLGVWSVAGDSNKVYLGYIKAMLPFRGTWNGIKSFNLD